jgi:hypothetical protein
MAARVLAALGGRVGSALTAAGRTATSITAAIKTAAHLLIA